MNEPPRHAAVRPDPRGFTLVEVILAVSILAVVVLLATAALRVGLRAWEAGQRRVEVQQEGRALLELVTDALAGAFPYRGPLGSGPERVVLFEGEPEEVHFITSAPPMMLNAPVGAFHAVVLRRKGPDSLRVVERLVPADEPFASEPERVLSRSVTRFTLAYRDETGAWQERWSGRDTDGIPTAVRVELAVSGLAHAAPAVVVSLPLGKRKR